MDVSGSEVVQGTIGKMGQINGPKSMQTRERYVSIYTEEPTRVLNRLGHAGLMEMEGVARDAVLGHPLLRVLSSHKHQQSANGVTILLEDLNESRPTSY